MPTVQSVFFGVSGQDYDKGSQPSIAINRTNQCVAIHEGKDDGLFFRAGMVRNLVVGFDNSKPAAFTTGHNPTIALTRSGVVVEAHDRDGKIYYSVRELDGLVVKNATVQELPNQKPNSSDPSISINANGVVVLIFRSGGDLYWRRGTLSVMNLAWAASSHLLVPNGDKPSVSINSTGRIVAVYQNGDVLYYRTGHYVAPTATTAAKLMWPDPNAPQVTYDKGNDPSVVLTSDNAVLEVHRNEDASELFQRVGVLSSDASTIAWHAYFGGDDDSRQYDKGNLPRIAANGSVAIEVHESGGDLYTNASLIFDRANWMHDNFGQLKDVALKELVLPASHDAGQYPDDKGGRTQSLSILGQLEAGTRFFDIRLVKDVVGEIRVHHDIFAADLFQKILDDIRTFMNDHAELVILKISHFLEFNQSVFDNTVAMIRDDKKGIVSWLVTRQLEKRLGNTTVKELLGRNVGSVLVVVDKDGDTDYLAAARLAPKNAGIRRYRDWYASDPQNGDLTVFDVFSDTEDFDDMATGTKPDPDKVNAVLRNGTRLPQGQFPKFDLFDGKCRNLAPDNDEVQCDMFLLSWTLTPAGTRASNALFSPITTGDAAKTNKQLVDFSAAHSAENNAKRVINLLYTDEVQGSRSVDVALIRNNLV